MEVVRPPMSESDFTPKPQPLVLRVEISAEQASALAPLFDGVALPALPAAPTSAPVPDEAVDERLRDLELREAEFEADVQVREDKMERWRTELEELEQTLERRERDLVSYVDQLQGAMSGSGNDAWWQRPAGGDGGVY
jgi:septal ring factor EnvC (AmiA/AmiB activator)